MKVNLGPLEHLVLSIIWSQEKATVYSVIEELKTKKDLAYTTVMTVMCRLVCKGILKREKVGKVYYYKPAQTKKVFLRALIRKNISTCICRYGEDAQQTYLEEIKSLLK